MTLAWDDKKLNKDNFLCFCLLTCWLETVDQFCTREWAEDGHQRVSGWCRSPGPQWSQQPQISGGNLRLKHVKSLLFFNFLTLSRQGIMKQVFTLGLFFYRIIFFYSWGIKMSKNSNLRTYANIIPNDYIFWIILIYITMVTNPYSCEIKFDSWKFIKKTI